MRILIVGMAMALLCGCGAVDFDATATSAVGYWGADVVMLVAMGDIAGDLPGWRVDGQWGEQVQVSPPAVVRNVLAGWAREQEVEFAVIPTTEAGLDSDDEDVLQQLLGLAILSANYRGRRCLLIFTNSERVEFLRSELTAAGLLDITLDARSDRAHDSLCAD